MEEDRITAPALPEQVRVKNPKRVAAGKALAERNRKARAALDKETEAD